MAASPGSGEYQRIKPDRDNRYRKRLPTAQTVETVLLAIEGRKALGSAIDIAKREFIYI
jgi:hypothetical protein